MVCPSYRRSLQLSKDAIQHFKTWTFTNFRIRIRIHWTDRIRIQSGSGSETLEKLREKVSFLLASWRSMTKIAGAGSGSISQRHESADPDPEPDPDPWVTGTNPRILIRSRTRTKMSRIRNIIKIPVFLVLNLILRIFFIKLNQKSYGSVLSLLCHLACGSCGSGSPTLRTGIRYRTVRNI